MSYTIINPATEEAMEVIEHASLEQTDEAIARFDLTTGVTFNRAYKHVAEDLKKSLAGKLGQDAAANVALIQPLPVAAPKVVAGEPVAAPVAAASVATPVAKSRAKAAPKAAAEPKATKAKAEPLPKTELARIAERVRAGLCSQSMWPRSGTGRTSAGAL